MKHDAGRRQKANLLISVQLLLALGTVVPAEKFTMPASYLEQHISCTALPTIQGYDMLPLANQNYLQNSSFLMP